MRHLVLISVTFVLIGVVLASGSLIMVPYTVREEVRVDKSKTWIDENFALPPSTNRSRLIDSVASNNSIFEIVLMPSSPIVFRIISFSRDELVFEWLRGGTIFWTPPSLGGIWRLYFGNPSSTMVSVNVTVTEFYVKATEEQNVTYYRPLLDPITGFSGIIAIIIGTALNLRQTLSHAKSRTDTAHSPTEALQRHLTVELQYLIVR
jgi:hypothetical protein